MSLKYILPAALALAGRAFAQCSTATATIQSQGDASAISGCSTFSGSIAIATGTTDSIDLSGIRVITGNLIADNVTRMASLSSNTLASIGDSFTLSGLTILTTLNFPALTSVDTIDWTALPALQGLSFTSELQRASSVSITNTELYSLQGINLQVIDSLLLTNNIFLTSIDMQLGNVSNTLTIYSNGRNLQVSFPNLVWANNMTVGNAAQISIPSLASVNGSLGFYSGDFESLAAPNLTTVGSSLSLVGNSQFSNLSLPQLRSVGGALNFVNNTELSDIDLPQLVTVRGALNFRGNFSTVEIPELNLVQGAFTLQSGADISNACNHFNSLKGSNNVIRGKYTCNGNNGNANGDGTSSGGSTTSSSFAKPEYIPVAGTFLGVVAAVFGMF